MANKKRKNFRATVLLVLCVAAALCLLFRPSEITLTREGFSMNTVIRISVTGESDKGLGARLKNLLGSSIPDLQGALSQAFAIIDRLNSELSLYDPSSTLSHINARAGTGEFITVSDDVYKVVTQARNLCTMTGGVFNPLIGPVTRLWKINQTNHSDSPVPVQASLDAVLPLCDIANLELNESGTDKSVRLALEGAALDLGGIAKGYASHVIADALRAAAVKNALIDLGGNIYALGGQDMRIGVRDPLDPAGPPVVVVTVRDSAVITSGGYERFRVIDGVKYSHFFDPRTGQPVRNDMLSATLVTPDGSAADALATAFMILGSKRSTEFLRSHRELELGAILIRDVHADEIHEPNLEPKPEILVTENLRDRIALFNTNAHEIKFF